MGESRLNEIESSLLGNPLGCLEEVLAPSLGETFTNGNGGSRTPDTMIFSHVLSR